MKNSLTYIAHSIIGMVVIAGVIFTWQTALAANPSTKLSYQGYVAESGTAVSGSRDMKFRLCTEATLSTCVDGASEQWEEEITGVAVSSGFFTVELGNITTITEAILNEELHMLIQIKDSSNAYQSLVGSGNALQPVASVPYARIAHGVRSETAAPGGTYETGQLYYDDTTNALQVYDGGWNSIGGGTSTFAALTDTDVTTNAPATGDFLIYNRNAANTWDTIGLSGDISITLGTGVVQINPNAVAMGTDTTGNYIATVVDAGAGDITVTGSGSETAAVTLDITDDSLDFTELSDTLAVDATTTFDLDTAGADLNFDANTLYVDSSANKVGFGTAAPSHILSVTHATDPDVFLASGTPVANVQALIEASDDVFGLGAGLRGAGIGSTLNGASAAYGFFGDHNSNTGDANASVIRWQDFGTLNRVTGLLVTEDNLALSSHDGTDQVSFELDTSGANTYGKFTAADSTLYYFESTTDDGFHIEPQNDNDGEAYFYANRPTKKLVRYENDGDVIFGNDTDKVDEQYQFYVDDVITSDLYMMNIWNNAINTTTDSVSTAGLRISRNSNDLSGGVGAATTEYGLYVEGPTAADDGYSIYLDGVPDTDFIRTSNGASLTTGGVWTDVSDRSKKTNISDIPYGLETVLALDPVSYKLLQGDREDIGFIAQDVLEIVPEVVHGKKGSYSLAYSHLTAVLVQAIKELNAKIESPSVISNPDGITMTDRGTGEIYCLYIEYGEIERSAGECGNDTRPE